MPTQTLRLILGDQLSRGISSLRDIDPATDVVLMAEMAAEATYVRHHKKKIALVFSAMRHFADSMRRAGIRVDYVRLDDPGNEGTLRLELTRALRRHRPTRVVATEPGEYRLWRDMRQWAADCGLPVDIRADDRFFCGRAEFAAWAKGRRQLRMEFFYREMRRRHGVLMDSSGIPCGGAWNFDRENRKSLPPGVAAPPRFRSEPDSTTRDVLALVAARFADHFGDLEPFSFAVTAEDAEAAFAHFLAHALPGFGDYQDAMRSGDAVLFHSLLSVYLNIGLLDPRAVCRRVEAEYRAGRVPLNAAEGFIRQILGWREYVRGIYWLKMPEYAEMNALDAGRPLPAFYWSGETEMNCLRQCIGQTRAEAYAHHIQRLMVTGNFALLAGLSPREVCEWYLIVYADALEWVELPNTHGMALFADGGVLGSKPYAASGKYIDRMSDYCRECRFDVRKVSGPEACPFNYLYWNFLIANERMLADNPRLAMPYRNLARMAPERVQAIRASAQAFLSTLR
jgi:deoxyribodipyrimidine photolyase-related protein